MSHLKQCFSFYFSVTQKPSTLSRWKHTTSLAHHGQSHHLPQPWFPEYQSKIPSLLAWPARSPNMPPPPGSYLHFCSQNDKLQALALDDTDDNSRQDLSYSMWKGWSLFWSSWAEKISSLWQHFGWFRCIKTQWQLLTSWVPSSGEWREPPPGSVALSAASATDAHCAGLDLGMQREHVPTLAPAGRMELNRAVLLKPRNL